MNIRRQTALAFGIAEWASALDHLSALQQVGERCPVWIRKRIENEIRALVRMWPGVQELPKRDRAPLVIARARRWLAEHPDELEDVLRNR